MERVKRTKRAPVADVPPIERLRALLDLKLPFGEALRATLASIEPQLDVRGVVPRFAARHQLDRSCVANAFYGRRPATDEMVEALAAELGGQCHWELRELFKAQREQMAASLSA